MTRRRLAVWGDPIAHSKSPALHAAAYDVLGLDWEYGRQRVDAAGFGDAIGALDDTWRGLSLTMPLKEAAHDRSDVLDPHAEATGAVNTLLFGERTSGFNTDVGGIMDALTEQGLGEREHVRILGAGATAASALVAAAELGARRIDVRARRPEKAADLVALGDRLGVAVSASALSDPASPVELTIATLPGGAALDPAVVEPLSATGGALFDVAYSPWPSALATTWGGGPAISGLGMLLFQAVRQIRIFDHGDPAVPLRDEDAVITAMRAAL